MAKNARIVRILGQVQCVDGESIVDLPSSSQRRLLASLAVHAPRPVRSEWLCNTMGLTAGALRQSVSRLRRSLGENAIRTTATGYQLVASVDAGLVEADYARVERDPDAIAALLDRWTDPP